MSEWREVKMVEVATLSWGDTTTTKAKYTPDGYPAYSASGRDGHLPYYDHDGEAIVISAIGARCGKSWFATGRWSSIKNTMWVKADVQFADSRFLYYATQEPDFWPRRGAAQPFISLGDARATAVRIPRVDTQRRISAALAAFDELIAINERRIELLEGLARSLYREWFVRLRFPGHNSAIDGLPDRWQRRPASQVFMVNPRIRSHQTAFPKVTMRDVDERFAIVFPSEVVARASGSRFQRDDVLFARITPCLENGKTALAKFLEQGVMGVGSTEFIVLRGVTVGPAFTYCAARSDAVRQHAIKSMSGASGRQRVASNAFNALELVEPSADVAAAFERCVGPLLDEGFALALQNRALAHTRDLLLPRLVTGRLDISDVDLGKLLPEEMAS